MIWPLALACVLPPWTYRHDMLTMMCYILIILITCLTTTNMAMFCSVIFRKTSVALMTSYLAIIVLFFLPVLVDVFAKMFFYDAPFRQALPDYLFTSPFVAAFSLPLSFSQNQAVANSSTVWSGETAIVFFWFYLTVDLVLIWLMLGLFKTRWRVAR